MAGKLRKQDGYVLKTSMAYFKRPKGNFDHFLVSMMKKRTRNTT